MAGRTFETKLVRGRVVWSPFTSEETANIAQVTLNHITARIQAVQTVEDSPAKPLNPKYAAEKAKGRRVSFGGPQIYKGLPVRDWKLRGRTLQSLKVKRASEDMATMGPISQEAYMIIKARNKLDHLWGTSPSDIEAMQNAILEALRTHVHLKIEPGVAA